jgi:hypothetical protein
VEGSRSERKAAKTAARAEFERKHSAIKQVLARASMRPGVDVEAEINAIIQGDGAPAPVTPGPTQATENLPTATNPQTGEKLVLRNGQWEPLQ